VEETIGYEALISPEDWAELDFATDWEEPEDGHHVSVWYPPGDHVGNENRFEMECDQCGHIGAADTLDQAEALAHLHVHLRARVANKEVGQ
jgi:hypothetical protein